MGAALGYVPTKSIDCCTEYPVSVLRYKAVEHEAFTRLDHKEGGYEALSVPQACGFPRVVADPPFR